MIGFFHPGTKRGMFLQMIGSRKTVPPRMLRMVPFGLSHIFFSLNSSTLETTIKQIAECDHATTILPLFVRRDRGALDSNVVLLGRLGTLDRDFVVGGVTVRQTQIVVLDVDVDVGENKLNNDPS